MKTAEEWKEEHPLYLAYTPNSVIEEIQQEAYLEGKKEIEALIKRYDFELSINENCLPVTKVQLIQIRIEILCQKSIISELKKLIK